MCIRGFGEEERGGSVKCRDDREECEARGKGDVQWLWTRSVASVEDVSHRWVAEVGSGSEAEDDL
jgi:hypothetical protein